MANTEKHLPFRFQKINEFMDFCLAVDPELEEIESINQKWLKNKFPREADIDGIKLFEEILGIKPESSESLESRRSRVIAKLNERLPYTWIQLHRMMAAICGWDGYKLKLEDFILTVYLAMDSAGHIKAVMDMLKEVLPMHIYIHIQQAVDYFSPLILCPVSYEQAHLSILPRQTKNKTFTVKTDIGVFDEHIASLTIRPRQTKALTYINHPVHLGTEISMCLEVKPRQRQLRNDQGKVMLGIGNYIEQSITVNPRRKSYGY